MVVNEFIRIAHLTDDEKEVLLLHVDGKSRVSISTKTNLSLATVDRIIKSLKMKYDYAQRESDILPPRKKTMKDLYKHNDKLHDEEISS